MTAMTRGPLPARVYWLRRLLVLFVAVALVAGIARVLTLGSDASSPDPRASQVAAEGGSPSGEETTATDPATTAAPAGEETGPRRPKQKRTAKPARDRGPVLAEPEGVCADRDIAVTPTVRNPVGGAPIRFVLELRTIATPACTWQVSPTTLTMRITSGQDQIWSSQDCPRAIPKRDLVVRDNATTTVPVVWSARRSGPECSPAMNDWALPGWYHVDAAALAGEPSDLQFQLLAPEPGVVLETVEPEPEKRDEQGRDGSRERDGGREGRGRG
jgi:hypothetical protein